MNTAKTLELLRSEAADIRMRELYGADKAEENINSCWQYLCRIG